jgi:hypothetical protein
MALTVGARPECKNARRHAVTVEFAGSPGTQARVERGTRGANAWRR